MQTMMKIQKIKSHSEFDQAYLKKICDYLCDNIEGLVNHFDLDYRINNKFLSMKCPIHGGDNEGAINIYYTGETYRGNWKCRTHHCEDTFKGSIIGFIRGILSRRIENWGKNGDSFVSFNDTLKYIEQHLKNLDQDKKFLNKEKESFVSTTKILSEKKQQSNIPRDIVKKTLEIPSKYFISRGFAKDILIKYDVGECHTYGKEMYRRAVVPVYDSEGRYMVGCSGRSINGKCEKCSYYHHENYDCPGKQNSWKYCKWKHSSGFKSQENLYNFWFAKDYIRSTGSVVVVESPGNVWKLEENLIHNSVALFGSSFSDRQKMILDTSGAMNMIIIMDSDDAGNRAREAIYKKCYKTYNINNIYITKNDIADMTNEEISKEIKNFI